VSERGVGRCISNLLGALGDLFLSGFLEIGAGLELAILTKTFSAHVPSISSKALGRVSMKVKPVIGIPAR